MFTPSEDKLHRRGRRSTLLSQHELAFSIAFYATDRLTHPTIDKLHQLRCAGMTAALAERLHSPEYEALSFEERLGLLADRELTLRDDRRMTSRLRRAKLRHPNACIEDIDFRHPRRLDKALIRSLASARWLRERLNILITGPTGVGKSWLACALAHHACREREPPRVSRRVICLSQAAIADPCSWWS